MLLPLIGVPAVPAVSWRELHELMQEAGYPGPRPAPARRTVSRLGTAGAHGAARATPPFSPCSKSPLVVWDEPEQVQRRRRAASGRGWSRSSARPPTIRTRSSSAGKSWSSRRAAGRRWLCSNWSWRRRRRPTQLPHPHPARP